MDKDDILVYDVTDSDTSDLKVLYCGREICSKDKVIQNTVSTKYALHFVIQGKGTLKTDNARYNLSKGDMFLICPTTNMSYFPDRDEPWQYIWIDFLGSRVQSYLQRAELDEKHPVLYNQAKKIQSLFFKCFALSSQKYGQDLATVACLYEIFSIIIFNKHSNETPRKNFDNHIDKALTFIDENYSNQNFSAIDIATFLNLNESYFSKLFKKTMGKSFREYLITYRIDKAAMLMKSSNLFISQIANNVGYSDPYYFSNSFKRVKGVSPKTYYNHIKKERKEK